MRSSLGTCMADGCCAAVGFAAACTPGEWQQRAKHTLEHQWRRVASDAQQPPEPCSQHGVPAVVCLRQPGHAKRQE